MKKVYTSIINFYDNENKIDYKKTKSLIENNLKNDNTKFYFNTANYNSSHLDCREKREYYNQIAALIPAETEVLFDLDFNSKKEYMIALRKV